MSVTRSSEAIVLARVRKRADFADVLAKTVPTHKVVSLSRNSVSKYGNRKDAVERNQDDLQITSELFS